MRSAPGDSEMPAAYTRWGLAAQTGRVRLGTMVTGGPANGSLRLVAGYADAATCSTSSTAAAELGIEHLVVLTAGPWTADALATLAAAIPSLRQVGPEVSGPTHGGTG